MSHDPMVLAYLAGALDADGHITVTRSLRTKGKRYTHAPTYYHPRIGFTSTDRNVPEFFLGTFGGAVHQHRPRNIAHKQVFIWSVGTAMVKDVARALRPFLRLKARQADLAAALCDIITVQRAEQKRTQKPPYRITDDQLSERARIWEQVAALNQPRNRRVYPISAAGRLLDGREHNDMPMKAGPAIAGVMEGVWK